MFDCGEGTVRQIIESSVKVGRLDSVFITHLHGDHVPDAANKNSFYYFSFMDCPDWE